MRKIVSVFLILVLVLGLCACSNEQRIVGTWKHQTTILGVVTETTYEFKEDGTGTMTGVLPIEFTYKFVDGELHITTNTLGLENTTKYTFEFSGDKLTLKTGDSTLVLNKNK